ncbi:MAG: glycosyltransferase [Rhodospirillaceae bacterium]|jgi:glycosyltransferase involved in cell wall biosynthesis|nr:glycosyltransferase [Rhodospirillaceae bacterium]MBT4772780.1 glycosyltransferase [Rhodospirillaceae bacterium]MBT5359287.1 glycosyltransferase [Rhodospirillaceae bacterium]MBT5770988.1 glycosyltransferase [Rhodospirillaceae bacterium]MBT6309208.1 glycosyltransferase [Rhodospirillaceae bacterium]
MAPNAIISNGFGRFSLRLAAAEAARRDALTAFITGAYPTPGLARALSALGLSRLKPVRRFLGREDSIPGTRVRAMWAGEPFSQVASRMRHLPAVGDLLADRLHMFARVLYARGASRVIRREADPSGPGVYHYRAGFGGASVALARERGWVCLCEYSIAHLSVLEHLVRNGGQMPAPGEAGPIDVNWRAIRDDLNRADQVLANSDFVKETFVHQGWAPDRVNVIYRGIDDGFLSTLPDHAPENLDVDAPDAGPLQLLFAGSVRRRKGTDDLADAMAALEGVDLQLGVCGSVDREGGAAFEQFRADPRVTYHGNLLPAELAARMVAADVFVFPTLAEGSARVVFEAMAAGCYVVTTANAGSIVEDGVHGRLVAPGNPDALAAALREAAADRARVAQVGRDNAALIRRDHRQAEYGTRLFELYERLSRR